jgi:hypothetical protein
MADPDPNNIGVFLVNLTTEMVSIIIELAGFWTTFIIILVN